MKLLWTISNSIVKGYRVIKARAAKNNPETAKAAMPFGFDSSPSKNFLAVYADTQNNAEPIIIGYLNPKAIEELGVGDSIMYATDSNGELKSKIIARNNGTLELLGTGNFLVKYNELATAFNELQQQWNTFAAAYVPGGPAVQGLPPTALNSTADITQAKNDNIKTS